MPGTTGQVRLTEAENERIFQRRVLPAFIAAEQGSPLPKAREAVVLGGQPGSGKTGQLEASAANLKTRGATWVINGDDFYAFHPAYRELQRKHGAEAAHMVKDEASVLVKKTMEAAKERGVNIVFESTMRQPEVVQSTLQGLRDKGYSVHAKVLAVKEQASWQGNHMRFETLSLHGAYPRLTSRDTHDAGVKGVLKTIAGIEHKGLADRLTVHQRNGKVIHDSEQQQYKSASKSPASDAIVKERDRQWSTTEVARHTKNWQTIEALAVKRHERELITPKRVAQEREAISTHRHADERELSATKTPQRTISGPSKDR